MLRLNQLKGEESHECKTRALPAMTFVASSSGQEDPMASSTKNQLK